MTYSCPVSYGILEEILRKRKNEYGKTTYERAAYGKTVYGI